MSVLLPLTLIYVAVLVLAVASSLIAIVYFLHGARANLAQIASSLREVNWNVEPLQAAMTAVNDGLATLSTHLQSVQQNLSDADATLEGERRAG